MTAENIDPIEAFCISAKTLGRNNRMKWVMWRILENGQGGYSVLITDLKKLNEKYLQGSNSIKLDT